MFLNGHQRAYYSSSRWSHGGMILTRENERTLKKPVPLPLCSHFKSDSLWTKWGWSWLFLRVLWFSSANHHSTVAADLTYYCPTSCAIALIKQRIIIVSLVSKARALSQTLYWVGLGVKAGIMCAYSVLEVTVTLRLHQARSSILWQSSFQSSLLLLSSLCVQNCCCFKVFILECLRWIMLSHQDIQIFDHIFL
jgi:hypothetical protein